MLRWEKLFQNNYKTNLDSERIDVFEPGGGVSRVNIGRLITTSVTSHHTSMIFKMAGNLCVRYFCKR